MGAGANYTPQKVRLTKRQGDRIDTNPIGGEWYAKIDPVTGVIQWLRRKVKKK